ncbi:MAG: carboxypeptidase regulatory-like domain-containing protein [Proteobacteria bacterium]|nr:carboxypeptidase regulatory-like domain-containing protein [Pseudomonadota bacterium]
MKKWNMIIDVAKCHDCNNCFLACKDEYVDNDWPPYTLAQPWHGQRWMDIMRKERGQYPHVDVGYRPTPCMHCDNAPCIKAAKDGAVYKRDDGIVIIDPEKAKGQKDLVKSCPYHVIWWNADKALPQKCTFCLHLLEDGWKVPRCVHACPTDSIQVVFAEDAQMEKIKKAEDLEVLQPDLKTKPRVYYKNLYRYDKCFIAGSVALQDKDECAEGAKVTLSKGKKAVGNVETNNYGDFKIDRLEENSGRYTLEVAFPGYKSKKVEVDLKESVSVGNIFL